MPAISNSPPAALARIKARQVLDSSSQRKLSKHPRSSGNSVFPGRNGITQYPQDSFSKRFRIRRVDQNTGLAVQYTICKAADARCHRRTFHEQCFDSAAQVLAERRLYRDIERPKDGRDVGPEAREDHTLVEAEFCDELLHTRKVSTSALFHPEPIKRNFA